MQVPGVFVTGAYGTRTHGLLTASQTRSQLRQCPSSLSMILLQNPDTGKNLFNKFVGKPPEVSYPIENLGID